MVLAATVFLTARALSQHLEPYIRQQALEYLQRRFESEVQLPTLRIRLPRMSPLRLILSRGRGGVARVEGENLVLRQHGRRDVPPLFRIRRFSFDFDLGGLFQSPKSLSQVNIDGIEIDVPPREDRPGTRAAELPAAVQIEKVSIRNALLVILPKDPSKIPLRFDIHQIRLDSVGAAAGMHYEAALTNPKPPGEISARGTFGPWVAANPGDTPLAGNYHFHNADLGVFPAIAGTLSSTGSFQGTLDTIHANGEATVPDFRLKMAGNRVPLSTRFEVLVDGTNGNTVLQPVHAVLGTTPFTTSGSVIKHEGDSRRSVALQVHMPRGNLTDLLRLAVKGSPFMQGQIVLETRIEIPPLTGKTRDKLVLDGRFEISGGKFLRSTIQDQIDNLSRKGQGAPKNQEIDQVVSYMDGEFHLENQLFEFRDLAFGVPGAHVRLAGTYALDRDAVDLHGNLRLRAKVSQTMTGWKRWALRPVDPFFSKGGAGTFLKIQVTGSSDHPRFGLDHGKKDAHAPAGDADRANIPSSAPSNHPTADR